MKLETIDFEDIPNTEGQTIRDCYLICHAQRGWLVVYKSGGYLRTKEDQEHIFERNKYVSDIYALSRKRTDL